jgi:hypothetical protein
LDDTLRGMIEKNIDDMMADLQVTKDVEWIHSEMPVLSLKDFLIGYMVGALKAISVIYSTRIKKPGDSFAETEKEIMKIIKRRLPEIVEKANRELDA